MIWTTRTFVLAALLWSMGCSAETRPAPSRSGAPAPGPVADSGGVTAGPTDASPSGGASDFGNPSQPTSTAGAPAPVMGTAQPRGPADCTGGLYLGTYDCMVNLGGLEFPLMGDVSFTLEIDARAVAGDCDAEFCPDLVIAEGSGTLFGLAGLTGFEAELAGGLDCVTGEFRASAPAGVYGVAGSSDPADPNALWTVFDPPFGMFEGELSGQHEGGPPERISGEWDLSEALNGTNCAGPFSVALQ